MQWQRRPKAGMGCSEGVGRFARIISAGNGARGANILRLSQIINVSEKERRDLIALIPESVARENDTVFFHSF